MSEMVLRIKLHVDDVNTGQAALAVGAPNVGTTLNAETLAGIREHVESSVELMLSEQLAEYDVHVHSTFVSQMPPD